MQPHVGWTSQMALVVKSPPASTGGAEDLGSNPGSGRSSGGGHCNPLQYSCLEKPMDKGAWALQSTGSQELDTTERLSTTTTSCLSKVYIFLNFKFVYFLIEG